MIISGKLSAVCNQASTAVDSDDENTCTFVDVRSAVWLTGYKILVYEKSVSRFRTIKLAGKLLILTRGDISTLLSATPIFNVVIIL